MSQAQLVRAFEGKSRERLRVTNLRLRTGSQPRRHAAAGISAGQVLPLSAESVPGEAVGMRSGDGVVSAARTLALPRSTR